MGTKERRQREFDRREAEILDAAFGLFKKFGLEKVTIDMIAEQSEIAKGTVYKHFKSKDEIFAGLCSRHIVALGQYVSQVNTKLEPVGKLREFCKYYLESALKDLKGYKLVMECRERMVLSGLRPEVKDKLIKLFRMQIAEVQTILNQAKQEGKVRDEPTDHLTCLGLGILEGSLKILGHAPYDLKIVDQERFLDLVQNVLAIGIKQPEKKEVTPWKTF